MPVTISLFFDRLRASDLLEDDDVESLWQRVPADKRNVAAEKLAPKLVDAGKLTPYQAAALLAGSSDPLVLGEYAVLERIGAGGMGQVYKAEHRRMKRIVALKVLSADAVRSPDAVKRFHREVQAAARLLHPNIVTAFDAGEADNVHFLVMEYVEGEDLAAITKTQGQLPVDRAVDYVLQAARGLDYAHGRGIVHRDIKPANLLVDRTGTVKILDMGLARVEASAGAAAMGMREQLTQSGQVMGTLDYMAPEQAYDTRSADGRSDIYSLGCTLYRMLSGETLFAGDSLVQVIMAHREQTVPFLHKTRPDVPPELDAILQKMLAKKPEERQASMFELVTALEAIKTGAPAGVTSTEAVSDDQLSNFFKDLENKPSRPLPRQTAATPAPPPESPGTDSPPVITVRTIGSGSTAKAFKLSGDTIPRANVASDQESSSGDRLSTDGLPAKRPLALIIGAAAAGCVLLLVAAIAIGWYATRDSTTPAGKGGKKSAKDSKPSSSTTTKGAGGKEPKPGPAGPTANPTANPTTSEPGPLPKGLPAVKLSGLLFDPPKVEGLGRWQVDTAVPRRPISAIAWAPDNRKVALGGEAGVLCIYDTQDWRLVNVMFGHTAAITAVAWSPDGARLASCGNDNSVRLWHADGTPGPTVPVVSKRNRPSSLAFSPTGDWLAVASSNKSLGKPELFTPNGSPGPACAGITGGVLGLAWHFEGKQFVTGSDDKSVRLWHLDGTVGKELKGHAAAVRGVSWGRNGQVAAVDTAGNVYIHPADGTPPKEFTKLGSKSVAWSPDGMLLAVGLASSIQIWDAEGNPTQQQQPTYGAPTSITWSPDGKRLAWAGGSVGVWEPGSSASLLAKGTAPNFVGWNQNGSRFISIHDDDRLRWWRSDGVQEEASPVASSALTTAAWSPSGQLVAAGGGKSVFLWGADRAPQPGFDPKQTAIRALAWNSAGNQLLVAGNAARLHVWDLAGTSVAELKGHEKRQVNHVDWSKASGQIATAGNDNTLRFWQSDGTPGPEVADLTVTALKWNSEGKELAVAVTDKREHKLQVYSPAGHLISETKTPAVVNSLAWSPDGERVASADRSGLVRIWIRTLERSSSLSGHVGEVRSIGWSMEGKLLSAGDDRTIRCWDASSGAATWVAAATTDGEFVTIGADGKPLGPQTIAEKQVVFFVERAEGRIEIQTPTAFATTAATAPAAVTP